MVVGILAKLALTLTAGLRFPFSCPGSLSSMKQGGMAEGLPERYSVCWGDWKLEIIGNFVFASWLTNLYMSIHVKYNTYIVCCPHQVSVHDGSSLCGLKSWCLCSFSNHPESPSSYLVRLDLWVISGGRGAASGLSADIQLCSSFSGSGGTGGGRWTWSIVVSRTWTGWFLLAGYRGATGTVHTAEQHQCSYDNNSLGCHGLSLAFRLFKSLICEMEEENFNSNSSQYVVKIFYQFSVLSEF